MKTIPIRQHARSMSDLFLPIRVLLMASSVVLLLISPAKIVAGEENDPHAHHKKNNKSISAPQNSFEQIDLPNTQLVNRLGNKVKLQQDVIANQIVVMDFVYTSCTTVCPVLSAIMSSLQSKFAEHMGENVVLVSLTVDPIRDTAERLSQYSKKHKAGPNWHWLTGDKTNVDYVLNKLGAYTPNFEDHPSMVIVGDPISGQWSRFFGFPDPAKIEKKVNQLVNQRRNTKIGRLNKGYSYEE